MGHGTRGVGRGTGELGGRGSCRAETAASSEWRVANSGTAANGEWRVADSEWRMANGFFLEGSAPALPKNFGTSGDVPSNFSACFSKFVLQPPTLVGERTFERRR